MSPENSDEVSAPEAEITNPESTQPDSLLMWAIVVVGIIVLLCGQFWGVRPGTKGSKTGGERIPQGNLDTQTNLPPGGSSQE